MQQEIIKFKTSDGKVLLFKLSKFSEEVPIDELLSINYSNIFGELLTFPVVLNRFGLLLAEAEDELNIAKLNLEIAESKLYSNLLKTKTIKVNEKVRKPAQAELENLVKSDSAIIFLKKKFIKAQKLRNYINSIFWAAKNKSNNLEKLSLTIKDGDIESHLIEEKINGIVIKSRKPIIK